MAATAELRFYHGAEAAGSDVLGTVVRYKRADNDVQNSSNPLPKPATFQNFTWRKFCKMNWTTTPAGAISNLRWFVDQGSIAAGIHYFGRLNATYTSGGSADINGVQGFTDPAASAANEVLSGQFDTDGNSLTIQAGDVLTNPSTGEDNGGSQQGYLETHMGCSSDYAGGPGAITAFAFTYRYAET